MAEPTPHDVFHNTPDQVDYRATPSFGGDVAQEPVTRDDPNCAPAEVIGPGADHEIAVYDLPDQPRTYNQMALGIPAMDQGWSPDAWKRSTPDVHPRR